MAADTALGKGKLVEQMVQRLFKRQLIQGRGRSWRSSWRVEW
jgi:hypothetical protein